MGSPTIKDSISDSISEAARETQAYQRDPEFWPAFVQFDREGRHRALRGLLLALGFCALLVVVYGARVLFGALPVVLVASFAGYALGDTLGTVRTSWRSMDTMRGCSRCLARLLAKHDATCPECATKEHLDA